MVTAEILSTLEVTLYKSEEDTSTTLTYNQNNAINTSGHQLPALPSSRLSRVGTRTESLNHHHTMTSNILHTIEEHEEDDDEFVDEDIDRRAEDINIAHEEDREVNGNSSGVADMDNVGGVGILSRVRSANVNDVKGTVLDLSFPINTFV
eukprot:gene10449-11573_t